MPQSSNAGVFKRPLPEASPAPAGPRLASVPRDASRNQRLRPDARGATSLAEFFGAPRRVARREVLYRRGDAFNGLFLVRIGSFKSVALVDDGREQITGHFMAGDILGIEGLGLARHTHDVVALEDSELSVLPLARLDEVLRHPELLQALFERMAGDLHRGQELTILLGSLRAEERVATFLLDLAHRHQMRGDPSRELVLRMTREEIASFLGLTLETVSRTFSRLHAEGLVRVQGRAVALLDTAGLERVAGHPQAMNDDSNNHPETGAQDARRSR